LKNAAAAATILIEVIKTQKSNNIFLVFYASNVSGKKTSGGCTFKKLFLRT